MERQNNSSLQHLLKKGNIFENMYPSGDNFIETILYVLGEVYENVFTLQSILSIQSKIYESLCKLLSALFKKLPGTDIDVTRYQEQLLSVTPEPI